MKDMDIKAVFIGDKAENGPVYKMLLNKMVDEHLGLFWPQKAMKSGLQALGVGTCVPLSGQAFSEQFEDHLGTCGNTTSVESVGVFLTQHLVIKVACECNTRRSSPGYFMKIFLPS